MTALHGDELLGLVDLASVIESTGDVCDVWSLPDCDSGGTAVDMLAPEALVDFCPKCQTTLQMRSLHGPAAGPIDGGWLCGRCGLQAVDLADARSYCCGYRPSAGLQWELMGIDYAHGRPVDRLAYAAAMGRYLLAEERSPYSHNTEHPIVDLLCEVSFGIAGGYGPSPLDRRQRLGGGRDGPRCAQRWWLRRHRQTSRASTPPTRCPRGAGGSDRRASRSKV
ncbi:MAG: hypothetical protein IPG97_15455 [Microthrixaceae bacterium]|nr:hypothetical protein [Microthrixaceae bacterium]